MLFAAYRDRVGHRSVDMELPEGADVGDLAEEMARHYPDLTRNPSALVVAVNQEYRDHDEPLRDGDEAALIPPVSGGSFAKSK
jgi:molybdopterin converting factor subunit 1